MGDVPAEIDLVQEFVNTNDLEGESDDFATPEAVRSWLVDRSLLEAGTHVTEADRQQAVEMREALRDLIAVNAGGRAEPAVGEALDRVAARARFVVHFTSEGRAELHPDAPGVDGALGSILAAVHAAISEGTWPRLKICKKHSCRWAFYDRSKNRSRNWCSMAVCGNRVKAESYRQRRRA